MNGPPPALPKPDELLALHGVTAELFETLRAWFSVPTQVHLDLGSVDSAVRELSDPVLIAALAMRKLQALHLLSTPGVRTTTDVVVAIVGDLERALLQAPRMRLQVWAATTDWDEELSALTQADIDGAFGEGGDDQASRAEDHPAESGDDEDPAVVRFQQLHGALHLAARAVVEASDGEIRIFE